MLELTLFGGCLLKKVLKAVKDLANDVNFDCSAAGLSLQAMNSDTSVLVSLLLRSEAFEHYHCDRNISIGMKLKDMATMLECAENDDTITLKVDDDSRVVKFMFESPAYDKITNVEMKLKDIDTVKLEIPEDKYKTFVRMPSSEFEKICRDLSRIGDTVVISVTEEAIKFSTGGHIGTAYAVCSTTVDKPDDVATVIEMDKPVSLTVSLADLNSFTKATPLSNTVTLRLSSEFPLLVEYKITELGYIRFCLAPMIEDVEEETKP